MNDTLVTETTAPTSVDVTLSNFKAEVLDASRTQLVIVDFWAPWCGPCKQLMPTLEKVVRETKGAVKLAKIDIDKNQQIAAQMQVQSVPAVFAFYKGQPVDGFMGALPESQIKQWLAQLIQTTGAGGGDSDGLDKALLQAATLLKEGDAETALSIYTDIFHEAPDQVEAFAGILRCMLALGQTEKASMVLESAAPALAGHKILNPIRTALDLAAQAKKTGGSLQALKDKLAKAPNDHQARFDLAMAAYAAQDVQTAIDELLEIVRRDRKWKDDGARQQVVKLFEALGFDHPATVEGRKKLSTLLFS
ncbi:MAG: thioredoxin [Bdellovibrionales bacterium]|jgi:putative thioredoxin